MLTGQLEEPEIKDDPFINEVTLILYKSSPLFLSSLSLSPSLPPSLPPPSLPPSLPPPHSLSGWKCWSVSSGGWWISSGWTTQGRGDCQAVGGSNWKPVLLLCVLRACTECPSLPPALPPLPPSLCFSFPPFLSPTLPPLPPSLFLSLPSITHSLTLCVLHFWWWWFKDYHLLLCCVSDVLS